MSVDPRGEPGVQVPQSGKSRTVPFGVVEVLSPLALIGIIALFIVDYRDKVEEERIRKAHVVNQRAWGQLGGIIIDSWEKTKGMGTYDHSNEGILVQKDQWGTAIELSYLQEETVEFAVTRSAGPDKTMQTDDDYVYWNAWGSISGGARRGK